MCLPTGVISCFSGVQPEPHLMELFLELRCISSHKTLRNQQLVSSTVQGVRMMILTDWSQAPKEGGGGGPGKALLALNQPMIWAAVHPIYVRYLYFKEKENPRTSLLFHSARTVRRLDMGAKKIVSLL